MEDEDILHITADGIVTLIHPGTTEIFIVATGSKNYNIATKTVTVNVNSDVPGIAHIIQIDEAVKPTCTEAGKTEGSHCSVCNTVLKPQTTIKALGHTWSTWKTTKVATALATGTQARTCSRCKKIETRTIAKLKPTIKLTTSTFTLQIKKSVVLTPFVTGLAKGDYISSWKSSNTTIASVKNGKVIAAKKTGNAIITVRTKAGVSAKFKIKVQKGAVKTTSIKVNKRSVSLAVKQKFKIIPIIKPITSTQKVTYTISNKRVATVSPKGVITAKKKGTATITIKSGSKSVKVKVIVR